MNKKYDIIAVGMGPGAVFMAYELVKKNSGKKILLIEQGKRVEKRNCPIEKNRKKRGAITTKSVDCQYRMSLISLYNEVCYTKAILGR